MKRSIIYLIAFFITTSCLAQGVAVTAYGRRVVEASDSVEYVAVGSDFEAALASSQALYTIKVSPGIHTLSSLSNATALTIVGSGNLATTLLGTDLMLTQTADSIRFENLRIKQTGVAVGLAASLGVRYIFENCYLDMAKQEFGEVILRNCTWSQTLEFSDYTEVINCTGYNGTLQFEGEANGVVMGNKIFNLATDGITFSGSGTVKVFGNEVDAGTRYAFYAAGTTSIIFVLKNLFFNNSNSLQTFYYEGEDELDFGGNVLWNNGTAKTVYIDTDNRLELAANIGNNTYTIIGTSPAIYSYGLRLMEGTTLGGVTDETIADAIITQGRDIEWFAPEIVIYNSNNTPLEESACKQADNSTADPHGSFIHLVSNGKQRAVWGTDGRFYNQREYIFHVDNPDGLAGNYCILPLDSENDTLYVVDITMKVEDVQDYTADLVYLTVNRSVSTRMITLVAAVDRTAFYEVTRDSSHADWAGYGGGQATENRIPPSGELALDLPVTNADHLTFILNATSIIKNRDE